MTEGKPSGADERHDVLLRGDLKPVGRIRSASNATFLCEATLDGATVACVYKPVAGEQPLWDFLTEPWPAGNWAPISSRPRSAGISCRTPSFVADRLARAWSSWVEQRDEPEDAGLVDLCPSDSVPAGYISIVTAYDYSGGGEVTLVHADNPQLRRMALFDVVVNNADRKGGHILAGTDGRVYGVDHGVSLHCHDKLRTVLWGWAGDPIGDEDLAALTDLDTRLAGKLGTRLREYPTAAELAALRQRIRALLDDPVMPSPNGRRPLPWPAF